MPRRSLRVVEGLLGTERDDGVDRAVELLDAAERLLDQLGRMHPTLTDCSCQLGQHRRIMSGMSSDEPQVTYVSDEVMQAGMATTREYVIGLLYQGPAYTTRVLARSSGSTAAATSASAPTAC